MTSIKKQEIIEQEASMDCLKERFELAVERIAELTGEENTKEEFAAYFQKVAAFLQLLIETKAFLETGGLQTASLEELQDKNHKLYEDILPNNYQESYANPDFAVAKLGMELGQKLSFLYMEMRSLIGFIYEQDLEEIVIRLELFLEVYSAFVYEWQENKDLPKTETIKDILYWYVSDYADMAALKRTGQLLTQGNHFAADIVREANLSDLRYLFAYGEYVSVNELEMARFMNTLPQKTIDTMADTYTEGYRIGFINTGKDLSKKKIVDVRYRLGFERMIRKALENFESMGLMPAIYRNPYSYLYNPSIFKTGFYGAEPNRQCDFDHKDDRALFLDKNYVNRKLEVSRTAFEAYRQEALDYAGPALVETFGEENFEPINKEASMKLSDKQSKLWVEYRSRAGEIQREYIREEERSFTIIAFPVPEIGEVFEELFRETIRINTLDYKLYQGIQQTLIDTLDGMEYCEILGGNGNRTNLRISLHPIQDSAKETVFENCVADVNIPVGEVFTSPVLKGTTGTLHVKRVFLNGLEYRDLTLTFEDGMIKDYTCSNFASPDQNKAFVKENVLFRHETLPMGEFAIGTNTTAYTVARKLKVENKLPILIAEKMGPHFAVGDTCYSHAEDIRVYNPDGKEIISRDNEVSLLRKTNPGKAYFNCHTDITIPYDELDLLCGVKVNGEKVPVIKEGRFVLPGTEELNKALAE